MANNLNKSHFSSSVEQQLALSQISSTCLVAATFRCYRACHSGFRSRLFACWLLTDALSVRQTKMYALMP